MSGRFASTMSTVSSRSATLFAARARARRWAAARPALVALTAAALVGALTWTALGSGLLDVKRVDVVGATTLSAAQVRHVTSGFVGDPMLTVNTDGLRNSLAAIPSVASVDVVRSWPGTLHVR